MEQSFAKLFRASRFASLDHGGRQAITTPVANHALGDWGLKRTLPQSLRTNYVYIHCHDGHKKTTRYSVATSDVTAARRWRENFPPPEKRFPLPKLSMRIPDHPAITDEIRSLLNYTEPPKFISALSRVEYVELMGRAEKLRPVWKALVKDRVLKPSSWPQFLNITTRQEISSKIQGDGASFVHPPTYRCQDDVVPTEEPTNFVWGRILNRVDKGYAVGIGGYVAFCPATNYNLVSPSSGRRNLYKFYVVDARFDKKGRPEIYVTMKAPSSNDTIINTNVRPSTGGLLKELENKGFGSKVQLLSLIPKKK